jgi:hypothetical protein
MFIVLRAIGFEKEGNLEQPIFEALIICLNVHQEGGQG